MEDVGELWQDQRNMAALLLYRQHGSSQYSMDGTIGEDLVMRPAPASVRQYATRFEDSPDWDNWGSNSLDNSSRRADMEEEEEELPVDYAFLDEDETSDYNDIRSDMHSMRRRRGVESEPCLETAAHIVFRRRRPEQETHHSDYSAMETDMLPYSPKTGKSRHKRQIGRAQSELQSP